MTQVHFFSDKTLLTYIERANPSLALFGGCQLRIVCIDGQSIAKVYLERYVSNKYFGIAMFA